VRVEFESSFARDLRRVRDRRLRERIAHVIEQLEAAKDLQEVEGVKKLKDAEGAYRLRIGDFRLGFLLKDRVVILVRFLDRKEVYRFFP
jgi:mRNA interferase RelE/StbE